MTVLEPFYADPLVTLHLGDCLDVMRELPDASVDAVVTDPPYGLEFMGKEWDAFKATTGPAADWPEKGSTGPGRSFSPDSLRNRWQAKPGTYHNDTNFLATGDRIRYKAGHPYQTWCTGWASEAFRVLKPGGHLLAFGGTRTVHRLASAIEDAGFEIRDELVWIYASGFPKSLDVGKAMDRAAGAEREVVGFDHDKRRRAGHEQYEKTGDSWEHRGGKRNVYDNDKAATITAPATDLARQWDGWGTAIKPAHEPIVMARKPLAGTVAGNVAKWGTGAINIDGTRIPGEAWVRPNGEAGAGFKSVKFMGGAGLGEPTQTEGTRVNESGGRWPSNILLSDPELFDQPNPYVVGSGATTTNQQTRNSDDYSGEGMFADKRGAEYFGDSGGYSRFFIVPKADRAERERGLVGADGKRGNTHPTVKSLDLMRHLVRLVTPPGGTVLDPFLGSGTTAMAASEEGFRCIGIEREAEYLEIAKGRLMATPMGLGLDVPAGTPQRSTSTGHWPKTRTPGKDGWGFFGQEGLEERYEQPESLDEAFGPAEILTVEEFKGLLRTGLKPSDEESGA